MKLMEKSNEQGDMDKGYKAIDECKKLESIVAIIFNFLL